MNEPKSLVYWNVNQRKRKSVTRGGRAILQLELIAAFAYQNFNIRICQDRLEENKATAESSITRGPEGPL